ncbi:hypothetical protein KSP40_PGU016888 [Platanthera guangdongensis]|uniref:Uncharacterized protein n=1 Tax=Platanthera guangdongensis TaxID=2320717 RepID=A0ABR2MLY6_9ASPA
MGIRVRSVQIRPGTEGEGCLEGPEGSAGLLGGEIVEGREERWRGAPRPSTAVRGANSAVVCRSAHRPIGAPRMTAPPTTA